MQVKKLFLMLYALLVSLAMVVLVLMPIGCGSGGNGSGTNTNNSGGAGSVRGVVYDSAALDVEVQNATVTIAGQAIATRTVDNASAATPVGSYLLVNVPAGTDIAEVTLPTTGEKQRFAFSPPVIQGGVSVVDLFVNIGQIRGTILRPDGKPAAGAFVTYISDIRSDPTQTDADGKFLFPTVPKGSVRVESQFGPASDVRTVTVANGLLDLGTITLVEKSSTTPGLPYSIKGTVTDSSGTALGNISVALIRNNIQQETAVTGTDGKYQFAVPAGDYTLRISNENFAVAEKAASLISTNQPLTVDFTLVSR